mmetsp:Transcript_18563/g.46572  ORF Transcript_18563/g.46572 Transcript_18563/m.46572 type:complete len:121 (+) Transcript_18563:512-874(+)
MIGAGAMINSIRLGILLLLHALKGIARHCPAETLTNLVVDIYMVLQAAKQTPTSGHVFFALPLFPVCSWGSTVQKCSGLSEEGLDLFRDWTCSGSSSTERRRMDSDQSAVGGPSGDEPAV